MSDKATEEKTEWLQFSKTFFAIMRGKEHIGSAYTKANAALIVRAVNCHERLVEALQVLMDYANGEFSDQKERTYYVSLIAEAEGLEIPEEGK